MLKKKELSVEIEVLKQKITAEAEKIKRYKNRINQFNQDRLFQNNQETIWEVRI